MIDIKKITSDFPILSRSVHQHRLVYLDNAATTLKPQVVIDSIKQHYAHESANIHRGVHFLSEQGTLRYEETRLEVQKLLNAKHAHEIIFTKGTTDAINLVAQSFGEIFFKPGDEILLTSMEHHSNIVPWQLIAGKTGAKVIECPISDCGEIDLVAYQKLLRPGVTKMVATCHISNSLGTINPIKKMIDLAHAVGAKFLVDGAQAVAHCQIDVIDLDCDFYAFSAHKVLGPTGLGFLYGKESLLNTMPPYQGGGDMIDVVSFAGTSYNQLPHKFEAGTPHIAGGIAFKSALLYLQEVGLKNIAEYENELLVYAQNALAKMPEIKIIGTAEHKSAVISFIMQDAHPQDIGMLLDRQGVAVRTGHHCTQPLMKRFNITGTARASFAFYNTFEDIDIFITALKKVKEFL